MAAITAARMAERTCCCFSAIDQSTPTFSFRISGVKVSDEFWKRVEPLIPVRQRRTDKQYQRKAGAGRPPKDSRLVFEGIVYIVYVLRTGCQWKALPAEWFDSAGAIHALFLALHQLAAAISIFRKVPAKIP